MAPTAPGPERAALSRDLSEFLVELSIAIHKHAMYPDGHPSLEPAAAAVTRRAELLLETRSSVSLGVARQQLVIEGVATDPQHPVLRDLAARLHRHQLGAVSLFRGIEVPEVAAVLRQLAVDGERSGQPLGLGPRAALEAWPHVRLHPMSFERLELLEEVGEHGEGGVRAAQLWVGLARAALAVEAASGDGPPATEPSAIAQAIDAAPKNAAYDQVIVGYLLQIADELKASGGAESVVLRRRVSRLVGAMRPETVRRLIEMGGDAMQRRQFVLDAAHSMSVDAVLELVRAAAEASGETVSHGLLRMLSKMARHATTGPEAGRAAADGALREQVRSLVQGWTLADPHPDAYARALRDMAAAAPAVATDSGAEAPEPLRMVELALELDQEGQSLWRAVSSLVDGGQIGPLAEALEQLPGPTPTGREVWRRLVSPDVVRRLVTEPPAFKTLDQLLSRLDGAAMEPLLDALVASDSRATRRGLLDRLARAPVDIAPLLLQRLKDDRWYVQRNMLVLLDSLPGLPEGLSVATWTSHADARVRREALKLSLKIAAERDAAIVAAVDDPDPHVAGLALMAAHQGCPNGAVPVIDRRLFGRGTAGFPPELRLSAIKALGRARERQALELLLRLTDGGRTWFGRAKLAPKSPELMAALLALAAGWGRDARAQAVLQLAARSSDADVRMAVGRPA